MDEWYVNPIIDTIYGEAEATGLLDKMVSHMEDDFDKPFYEFHDYLAMIYQNALSGFGYKKGYTDLKVTTWRKRINVLYEERYGVKNVFNKEKLLRNTVFFAYLLCNPIDQQLNEDLSKELDVLVGQIAGPGEKYNTKVYMNEEMFKRIIILIYDRTIFIFGGDNINLKYSKSIWDVILDPGDFERVRDENPYADYNYPADFFIQKRFIDEEAEDIVYPNITGLVIINPKMNFMNWNSNPFDF